MSLSDPIGDMIARVKNAQERNHKMVALPSSNFKAKIADILNLNLLFEATFFTLLLTLYLFLMLVFNFIIFSFLLFLKQIDLFL